jgi:glyoxalase family protein
MRSAGIHHITAIASEPQPNLDFYTEVLGLHFVKRTVNFDDPGNYHFYFGDEIGKPGTLITFFPWPGARHGTRGSAQVTTVSFALAQDSLESWKERLREDGIAAEEIGRRFGESVLRFTDPDGLMLELVAPGKLSTNEPIAGLAAPALEVSRPGETEKLLSEVLGFEFVVEENNRRRFRGSGEGAGCFVDLVPTDAPIGWVAAGTVHHIAFRARDDDQQLRWREQLGRLGFSVTPVVDRQYFHSIYFREPSGILFEIATDGPGFTIDEPAEQLGESLKLPPIYEPMRPEIEGMLPPIELRHLAVR